MELIEAIKSRRSIRRFLDKPVAGEIVRKLIDTAVWAPSASNEQPWGFVVIEDRDYMRKLSEKAKAGLLSVMEQTPALQRYRALMENPDFNIFHNASVLVVIYGRRNRGWSKHDCSLAAQNLMLLAWERGLGTCWIGFAHKVCDTAEFKERHHVPEDFETAAPIVVGYPEFVPQNPVPRKEFPIFFWGEGS